MIESRQIAAIITFENLGTRGVVGQTVGADGAGLKAVVVLGNPDDMEATDKSVRELVGYIKSIRHKNLNVVYNYEEFLGRPITIKATP